MHRFGSAWADLVVATAVALGLATVPVLVAGSRGDRHGGTFVASVFSYGVAYFLLLGYVMLRGLPEPAPARAGGGDLRDRRHRGAGGVAGGARVPAATRWC